MVLHLQLRLVSGSEPKNRRSAPPFVATVLRITSSVSLPLSSTAETSLKTNENLFAFAVFAAHSVGQHNGTGCGVQLQWRALVTVALDAAQMTQLRRLRVCTNTPHAFSSKTRDVHSHRLSSITKSQLVTLLSCTSVTELYNLVI